MVKENQLLENKQMREEVIGRIEVLEQVKELLLLGDSEYATTEMVAKYYCVDNDVIKKVISRNKSELSDNGFKNYKKSQIEEILKGQHVTLEISIPNRGMNLFSKRAILNVGMLLRDSEVAKNIRSRLLDVAHDAQTDTASISTIVEEINEETLLQRHLGEAYFKGDLDLVLVTTTKINALKNKRIQELETQNEIIINHSTTIEESRSVINRIIRVISSKTGLYGKAWNEFYSKINYKLGINLKARNKKPLESMTAEEMYQSEIIARNWATKIGIDVEKILSLN